MDATLKKQAVKFDRARGALLAVAALTVVNLILEAFGAAFYLLYSAFFPRAVLILVADGTGSFLLGFILAILLTGVYLVCWALSKRYRFFVLIGMILFSFDTLFLFLIAISDGYFDTYFLIDLVICALVLYSLISGTIAWSKLRRFSPEELMAIQEKLQEEKEQEETESALEAILPKNENQPEQPDQQYQPEQLAGQVVQNQPDPAIQPAPSESPDQSDSAQQNSFLNQNDSPLDEAPTDRNDEMPSGVKQDSGVAADAESLRDRVIEIYKQRANVDKLYIFEEIPQEKFANAMKSYAAPLDSNEEVVMLFDDTLGGAAKEGFILTTKRLFCKNVFEKGQQAQLQHISSMTINTGKVSSKIIVAKDTGNEMRIDVSTTKDPAVALLTVLDQTIQLLK